MEFSVCTDSLRQLHSGKLRSSHVQTDFLRSTGIWTCLLRLNKRLTAGHGAIGCTERSLYLFIVHLVDFSSFWFLL